MDENPRRSTLATVLVTLVWLLGIAIVGLLAFWLSTALIIVLALGRLFRWLGAK